MVVEPPGDKPNCLEFLITTVDGRRELKDRLDIVCAEWEELQRLYGATHVIVHIR